MTVEELYGDSDINDDYEDDEPLDCCPKCWRDYDDIGADFQYCKACGWDAETEKWDKPIEPTQDDYLAGDADILTGRWF